MKIYFRSSYLSLSPDSQRCGTRALEATSRGGALCAGANTRTKCNCCTTIAFWHSQRRAALHATSQSCHFIAMHSSSDTFYVHTHVYGFCSFVNGFWCLADHEHMTYIFAYWRISTGLFFCDFVTISFLLTFVHPFSVRGIESLPLSTVHFPSLVT